MEYTLLYDDLTPTKKAAKEMEEKLPDLWTMSAESRKIFHFDIEEYDMVIRTIQLACEKKGILEPKIVSAETFYSWVAGPDPKKKKQVWKSDLLCFVLSIRLSSHDQDPVE